MKAFQSSYQFIVLKGTVFSGRGEGEFYINLYAKNIMKVLGIKPYPGTLNLKLDRGSANIASKYLIKDNAHYIIEPPFNNLARVYTWVGYIKCLKVYIIKPDITYYSSDVIELIADFSLRKRFGLKDGDLVELHVAINPSQRPSICIEVV